MSRFDLALLLLRLTVGITLMAHGYNKFKGGLAGTERWFESIGVRPGRLHAPLAATTEVSAGFGVAVGALTPLAASGIIAVMVVASIAAHARNGFFIFRPGEGWEYVMTLTFCGLLLAVIGPGEWSLDQAIGFDDRPGVRGLLAALVLGAGGAAALLAAFWRPPP
ncbi:MAG: putative oxidoreductase, partial [Acidimicrobiaceae bacterium]|nr:putative oxidoreductase [Acidimicrobiaceae bacterium]